MGTMFSWRRYIPVAERVQKAKTAAKKLEKRQSQLDPVRIEGRKIATSFWGKAWCDNLESYSDYENRLPRGRSYVRGGSVVDLRIRKGKVAAFVQGSDLYTVTIQFQPLKPKAWGDFKKRCAGKITNLMDLLRGRLSHEVLALLTDHETGLFPAPAEIEMKCSCPDWATMCKHVAATLYGVGARLDEKPELFFTLRGVDQQELFVEAQQAVTPANVSGPESEQAFTGVDLSDVFGIQLDTSVSSEGALPAVNASEKERVVPTEVPLAGKPKRMTRKSAKSSAKTDKKSSAKKQKPTRVSEQTNREAVRVWLRLRGGLKRGTDGS
jgi:uncharacterized Zn finger protein